ncbi:unnamed protein product [Calypogeia fissa]
MQRPYPTKNQDIGLDMAPSKPNGRNYRRKQPSSSSPQDSDQEFEHPPSRPNPLLRVAENLGFAHLNSSSLDLGLGDISSTTTPKRVLGDGDNGREGEAGGRGRGRGGEEQAGVSPSGGVDSGGLLAKTGVSQNGVKRIGRGIGYNILKSMGWRENTGLGQSSNGIIDPILPTPKPNHLGIGFNPTAFHDAAQEEIRQIQKAKREERDRKLQEKLEKAEAAEEEAIFMRESFLAEASSAHEPLSAMDASLQAASSHTQHSKPAASAQGNKPVEPGQCPHCKQRFDTKHALKSHINARHLRLLLAAKRQLKNERKHGGHRRGGKSSRSGRRQSAARSLAPMKQDFSVYD